MILRYYTFINLCAKLNIIFISANFFGKKLHFFTKKLVFYHISEDTYSIFNQISPATARFPFGAGYRVSPSRLVRNSH